MRRLTGWGVALLLPGVCAGGVFAADAAPELRAQLKAKRSALISSEMNGRIDMLALRDGERFSAGQPLVRLHCKVEESQLSKARAEEEKKHRTYEADSRLNTMQSVSVLELEVAKADLDVAKAEVRVMQAMLERCVIVAPFSGKVVETPAREHQFVRPGDPLLEILDDRDLEIEFIAPSRWLGWLKPGAKFELHVDENGNTYPAEVTRLGGRVDPVSQTVKVYGRLPQSANELFPGMSGAVRAHPPTP
jgi:RND family efflux transporter MFP subunit